MNLQSRLQTRHADPVPLQSVRARGEVQGTLLTMTVAQHYRNSSDKNMEVTYTFPLPWGAVLLEMDVHLNGSLLRGVVAAKQPARDRYEEALSEGHSAVLLVQNPDHSHTLELGNLLAGEDCIITLRYAQLLQVEQGSLRMTFPTTLAPRYGDPVRDGHSPLHAVVQADPLAEHLFGLSLWVGGSLAKARMHSPSHPVAIRHHGAGVALTLSRDGWLDRDFVLVMDELATPSLGLVAVDQLEAGAHAVLCNFVPSLVVAPAPLQAIKVLVDCSGSMSGDSLQAAQQALLSVVHALGPDDRFSLSRFGNTVEHRCKGLWVGAGPAKAAARRWVEGLAADMGGTEMASALTSTIGFADVQSAAVLLVTDGEIEDIDGVLAVAKASGHRLFIVGIGASPAEPHLRRLAQATQGACEFVAPGEAVQPAIGRMFHRLRTQPMTDLHIRWPRHIEPIHQVQSSHAAFDGDTLSFYAQVRCRDDASLDAPIVLWGRDHAGAAPQALGELRLERMPDESNSLARMVAHQRLQAMKVNRGAELTRVMEVDQLVLAERYQLLTQGTACILVHARSEAQRPGDMPELVQVRPMLAAGWGGYGQVSGLPMQPSFDRVSASFSAPAVRRTGRSQLAHGATTAMSLDHDVPHFLRKDMPEDPLMCWSAGSSLAELDRHGSDLECVECGSLTPLGYVQCLSRNEQGLWPCTYEQLLEVGLPSRVVEWLEWVVGESRSEAEVVAAFNGVVMDIVSVNEGAMTGKFKSPLPGPGVRQPLSSSILEVELRQRLDKIRPRQWPDGVLQYAEAPLHADEHDQGAWSVSSEPV